MKTFFGHDEILEMSDQGFTIFSYVWLLNHTPTTPHSMKPNSNQETAAGGRGKRSGVTQEVLPEVSTERKHTWKYPATYNETPCSRPSPFTGSPKHGHPQLPLHHPASPLFKKKKITKYRFLYYMFC